MIENEIIQSKKIFFVSLGKFGYEQLKTPVPSIQSASELNQNTFRTILTFSTDSERFQNSFCIDSETSLNQSKIQNLCPLNFSDSEENSECISELVLNQKKIQNTFLN